LSPSEPIPGRLKSKDGEPVFGEPWQAQAMAMAQLLMAEGLLTPSDWAEVLGEEVRKAEAAGGADTTETYYVAVISSLERLLVSASRVSREELARRKKEWEHAYERTPLGEPVTL
jgi:nitrile hydratase accessory protein